MEKILNHPAGDGLYWFKSDEEPQKRTIVRVWDWNTCMPMVDFLGTDWSQELSVVRGRWIGPLQIPRGF